jgi:serine protease Do
MSNRLVSATRTTALAVAGLAVSAQFALARPAPESFADLAEAVTPAVVNIQVEKTAVMAGGPGMEGELPFGPDSPFGDFFREFEKRFGLPPGQMPEAPPEDRKMVGAGSGFFIDPEGYVVTNNHVIDEADVITVITVEGDSYDATLVGRDAKTDLALLKVEADEDLPYVRWGDSDVVRPGDWVMAIGNPFGLGGTVTAGIVSARGRDLMTNALVDFIQIDAPINRGNSGGPSFNVEGDVIGVNSAIFSPNGGNIGIGFAIPSNLARDVVAQLRESGSVERGWLGVSIQNLTKELAEGFGLKEEHGALVADVTEDSPAARAGFKSGDVVLSWNGREVESSRDLARFVAESKVGEPVKAKVWRDHKEKVIKVEPGKAPVQQAAMLPTGGAAAQAEAAASLGDTGLTVAPLSDSLRARYGLDESAEGVVVTEVKRGSKAFENGIRPGDIIESVALQPVKNVTELSRALEKMREAGDKVATLKITRQNNDLFLALPIG